MKSLLPAGLLALSLAIPAFSEPVASPSLLGKRYVEAFAQYTDYNHFTSDYGAGATINVPVAAAFDAGATFLHNQQDGDSAQHYETLDLHLAAHRDLGPVRGFARATFGYEWWAVENLWWYRLDVGTERALTDRLLVSAHVSWQDFLSSDMLAGRFSVTPRATYWLTPAIAVSASGSYIETGDLSAKLGLAFVF
jgi:hypothetical protein